MTTGAEIRFSQLAELVGETNLICNPDDLVRYEVDGLSPSAAVRPGTAEEVVEVVRFVGAEKLAAIPTGACTKLAIGMPPEKYDLAIDLTRLDRVLAYDPNDLTLSVQAGIRVGRLLNTLAEHRQFLPLMVPFIDQATVGGTLASGVDTPLRQFYGTPRDYVLGMQFVTGSGVLAKSGGRVVKNVTGYDLHKLMLGAIGTLGVITSVNFKTFPQPSNTQTWTAAFRQPEEALTMARKISHSALTPYAIEVSGGSPANSRAPKNSDSRNSLKWHIAVSASGDPEVLDRYSRELRSVASACSAQSLATLEGSEEQLYWRQICEFESRVLSESVDAAIIRASVPPTELPVFVKRAEELAGRRGFNAQFLVRALGIVYIAMLPGEDTGTSFVSTPATARTILQAASAVSGYATIQWCPRHWKKSVNVWGDERKDVALMRKVKNVFDPQRILAPGRFVSGI